MHRITDCDHVLTIPNGDKITLTQCIIAIKTQVDYRSRLFLGVDIQENRSVIVTCDKSMQEEVESFLVHLVIYLQEFFGIIVYEVFSQEYKEEMNESVYCPDKKCTIKVFQSEGASYGSCGSSMATTESDNYINIMIAK